MMSIVRAPDFIYELANPALQALAPGKRLLGRRFADVWAEVADPLVEILQNVIKTGRTFRREDAPYSIQRGPGTGMVRVYVTYSCIPIPGPDGSPDRVLTLASETTGAVRFREDQSLLSTIMTGTSDAVYAKDAQGRYLVFNPAAERFTGKAAAEVLGHDDTVLFPPATAAAVMERDRRILEAGKATTVEEVLTTSDGRRITFLSTKGPLLDAAGRTNGMFGIARDITARRDSEKALRDSEEKHRRLFKNMAQGVIYHKPDGRDQLRQSRSGTHSRACLLYTSPSPRDRQKYRMPSSA